jgi:endonuclease YncB( thermonuclease family)
MKFLIATRLSARLGLALGLAGQVLAAPVPLTWEMARVTRVIDGDTYEVLTGGQVLRVRLLGVDAPEHDQAFGLQATDSATALLRGRLVRLQRHGLDLYGRTLGKLKLAGNGAGGGSIRCW